MGNNEFPIDPSFRVGAKDIGEGSHRISEPPSMLDPFNPF